MALALVITNAGRQALIDGETITHLAIGTSGYIATATATALQNEVTRVAVAGSSPVSGQLQIQAIDQSTDVYACKELGLITDQGTLFALYAQASTLIEKSSAAALVITADMAISSEDTASITFGNTNFLLPAASTSGPGVVQLDNSYTNTSQTKAPTANALRLLSNWVVSQLSGKAASSHSHSASDLPSASTSVKGVVQLETSYFSLSTTKAAAAIALKSLHDWITNRSLEDQGLLTGYCEFSGGTLGAFKLPVGWSNPSRIDEGIYEINCGNLALSTSQVILANRSDGLGYAKGEQISTSIYRFKVGINSATNQTAVLKDGNFHFMVQRG